MPRTISSADVYIKNHAANLINLEAGSQDIPDEWDYEYDYDVDDEEGGEEGDIPVSELIEFTPSEFTEAAFRMPDKINNTYVNFSFEGREYLRMIYDIGSKRTLLKCGRQVEKSTLLGNKLLSYCCLIRSLAALYVSPTSTQTKVFSRDRISEPIETSINLGPWLSTKLADNLLLKKLTNRSQITLRYAFQNADRVRGIPADIISLDEIQDILTDNIPVIEECASHSPFKIFMYSGTPKSLDNTLEHYWVNQSTQNEWVVPCYRHSTTTGAGDNNRSDAHWNVLDESNIFKHGLSCDKCEELINPVAEGSQWVALNPQIRDELEEPYEGFRIPQLMVPWITWSEILQKQKVYGRPEFYNEVLGLSYDSGTRPLTRQDVIDNCDPNLLLTDAAIEEMHVRTGRGQSSTIFAGIDWGTGENTFTVISLGTYIDGKFTIFYLKRFEGPESDPKFQLEFISHLIEKWNVNLVGADYGGGFDRNDALTRTFGYLRIAKYQYSAPSTKVKWDDGMRRWMVHRTECMSDVFNAIRRRDVFRFPNWDSFQNPFGDDFLSIFSEYNEQRRMNQYHKSPNATDDAFHSVLLCFLASMIRYPRPDVLAPNAETNSSGLNI